MLSYESQIHWHWLELLLSCHGLQDELGKFNIEDSDLKEKN